METSIAAFWLLEPGGTHTVAGAVIANLGASKSICSALQSNGNPPSSTLVTIAVHARGDSVPADTYPVTSMTSMGNYAFVIFEAQNAQCYMTTYATATGGTVTITSASSLSVAGTFDATFPSGDHLTGSFSAPVCSLKTTSDGGAAVCG